MTAEIAILNKEAVALATDSAATFSKGPDQKIFTSANKLFTLSKYHPIGIMIYGNSTLLDVPWETIIKMYRKKLGNSKFNMLDEYAKNFLEFLNNNKRLFSEKMQSKYFYDYITGYFFNRVKEDIKNEITKGIQNKNKINEADQRKVIEAVINRHFKSWREQKYLDSIPKSFGSSLIKKYHDLIEKSINDVFEQLPLTKNQKDKLYFIASQMFCRDKFSPSYTGVVIAGFGESEIFPSIRTYNLESIVNNRLKYSYIEGLSHGISFGNAAAIIPFAQNDMACAFMEGVDPAYQKLIEKVVSEILTKYNQIVIDHFLVKNVNELKKLEKSIQLLSQKFIDVSRFYREQQSIEPVINVVSMLPKNELATMAETFVNLTSFKRKITMDAETVGGPVDVAVISKGDGFIWIKRKHYFKPELNQHFLANYFKRQNNEKD